MIRLLAMAAWLPRVALFVSRLEPRFSRLPLPACLESITPPGPGGRPLLTAAEMARVIWNVLRWNRGRFNNGCFVRSLTRYHFFRRIGHPVSFRLGVEVREAAPAPPATLGELLVSPAYTHLRSHAWLTLDGEPFLEFEPARFSGYRVLFAFPAGEDRPGGKPAGSDQPGGRPSGDDRPGGKPAARPPEAPC